MRRLAALLGVGAVTFGALGAWTNREINGPTFGVTFSPMYARTLGEDPDAAYRAIVEELGVRRVRLPVYWSDVEGERDRLDFAAYDRLMRVSEEHGVSVTLAVGAKVPRWPECFSPGWAEPLEAQEFNQELFSFIGETVARYKGSPALERWQLENEAFFPFGVCPLPDVKRVFAEAEFLRSLDDHPIQMTASGELESWALTALPADVLGVSLYRTTWNDAYGYFRYPIPTAVYAIRAALVSLLADRVIISELQAEPWFFVPIADRSLEDWEKTFGAEDLRENAWYAEATGLPEAYFWGAEWWYHLKQNGRPALWDEARRWFQENDQ